MSKGTMEKLKALCFSFDDLQEEMIPWLEHNFPNQTPHQSVLGVCEEAGELAHAELKLQQGIRGTQAEHEEAMKDAIADIIIFCCNLAVTKGWNLRQIVYQVWSEVKKRDWKNNARTGKAESKMAKTKAVSPKSGRKT